MDCLTVKLSYLNDIEMNNHPEYHHRRSIRLNGYDYSKEGLYFITICIYERQCLFGAIENKIMILNDAGKFAQQCWQDIPAHFPNVILHEFIVMPNHVHGIIELVRVQNIGVQNTRAIVGVENFQPLHFGPIPSQPRRQNQFQKIIPRSVGSIIRGYKIGVTKWFRENTVGVENAGVVGVQNAGVVVGVQNFEPLRYEPRRIWQRNYYEHIIRDEQSYHRISDYIINNPSKWNDDTLK
jgi:putative transposase